MPGGKVRLIWKPILFFVLDFTRQGFSIALDPVLEFTLVDQASTELTELCLCLLSAGFKGVCHHARVPLYF